MGPSQLVFLCRIAAIGSFHPQTQALSQAASAQTTMERFLGGEGASRKLAKLTETTPSGDPTAIVSWNINGVVPRSEKNADEVRRFLATCGADCVFLSEVRLKAYCGVPKHKKGDGNARDRRKPQAKEEELDRVRALFDRDA